MNVTAYNYALITCTAHGFGLITIAWKRINYGLPNTASITENKTLNEFSSTLKITKVVGYYSGKYYCVAENEFGIDISQPANLHVQSNI